MSDLTLFALTIIPLVFTPGPDMLFILSQVMGKDAKAGIMATSGVCLGYTVHSILVALGISAIIVAYPILFETIRYVGVIYLLFLAFTLFRTAFTKGSDLSFNKKVAKNPIKKGFFTALLNPKGMLIYFAILPQFINKQGNTILQGLMLSFIFIGLCLIVYSVLSVIFARFVRGRNIQTKQQKWIDMGSGSLIMLAATWMLSNS
ncbi:LysE family translocator [Acinetobacter boissieri]|uniref:Threonine/homoserine/homoserine lactone efflux protein n=1 Tax=Acinetobacter boissieri TaxID=1219383 RepID=A0A1G6GTB7_9GAMM|nr:LysE family translocator [Acinetobacter boissieri]SDB84416.1 Threonine/homoserine/homoserine lactone efflux protein [Acinetobacter boissieri]